MAPLTICRIYIVGIFLMLLKISTSVEIDENIKKYIKITVRKYEEGSYTQEFSEIRPDRPKISECCSPLSFTLPNLFIWDPLLQFHDMFHVNPLVCEEHGHVVVPARWTDGSSNSLNPRVLLEDNGPALLVARDYYCKAGLMVISCDTLAKVICRSAIQAYTQVRFHFNICEETAELHFPRTVF